ncbi:MAG: DUF1573 domain-containing protein [Desulfobacterales bacterium]|jgi:hypothetical protein|nr:DUF1573 domain-containing protein [Desulfobacterales bacterium]
MKTKMLAVFFVAFSILLFGTGTVGLTGQSLQTPSVLIPESRYTFSPVLDGTEITHDFIIQNKGDAPLAIEKVRTG